MTSSQLCSRNSRCSGCIGLLVPLLRLLPQTCSQLVTVRPAHQELHLASGAKSASAPAASCQVSRLCLREIRKDWHRQTVLVLPLQSLHSAHHLRLPARQRCAKNSGLAVLSQTPSEMPQAAFRRDQPLPALLQIIPSVSLPCICDLKHLLAPRPFMRPCEANILCTLSHVSSGNCLATDNML